MARTGVSPSQSVGDSYVYDWPAIMSTLDGHVNAGPQWDHLVIDEGQDLPEGFFRYAKRHAASGLTVFADDDQALEDRSTSLEQIQAAAELPDPILLEDNHRCTPEVAAVAEHFHSGRLPAARVRRSSIREKPRLVRSPSLPETTQLIANWFSIRSGKIGVVVESNSWGRAIHRELNSLLPGRRVDRYNSRSPNEDVIDLLAPGVTVLNCKSAKGQEFDTVFLLELERMLPCRDELMRRMMYMLCSRARDHLFLVYGPAELSPEAAAALPCGHILERG